MEIPEKGYYVHYKHAPEGEKYNYMYEVVGIARHTEDKTFTVLYRPLYKNDWFEPANFQARPLDIFIENVNLHGVETPRFKRVTDPELIQELDAARSLMYEA